MLPEPPNSQGTEACMKRCAHCNGKFGLTQHRWYNVAFCSKRCREKYLDKLAQDRDRIKAWFGFVGGRARASQADGAPQRFPIL